MNRPSSVTSSVTLCAALLTSACGGEGILTITTYGEDFIEQGIDAAAFEDGGSVTFEKFLVSYTEIAVRGGDGVEGAVFSDGYVFDVVKPGPTEVATEALPGRRYEDISVVVAPAVAGAAGNADADDVTAMVEGGHAVFASGTAVHAGVSKTFAWGFAAATRYENCELEDGSVGVVVPAGGVAAWDLTVHGDHLFYDDVADEGAVLRMEAIVAADANDDGEVTLDELRAVDLTELPGDQYGTGGQSVTNLGDFIEQLTRSLVHHTGEGHCDSAAP